MKKLILFALILLLGLAAVSAQDWPMFNYDSNMSRHSPQTTINKDNVNQLQAKWILNTNFTIENPPLIIGDTGYVQTNSIMEVIAFDLDTGLTKWTYVPVIPTIAKLPRSTTSHGLAYENGIIYAPTGAAGSVVALDATNGKVIWDSGTIRPLGGAYRLSAPPLIWKNYVVAGSALGDLPPYGFPERGTVTGLDKKTGKILWQTKLAVGPWVEGVNNNSSNGGADVWTGGAIDMDKGIVYLPVGNAAPDFDASSRPGYNNYSSNVIALDIATGKILWATPFVAKGTVFNVTTPDTHDWDTAWGTMLVTADMGNGSQKVVIGHDKRGDIAALDADTGKVLWWRNIAHLYRSEVPPMPNGSGPVWPGPGAGIEDFTAADNDTIYAAVSNQGMIYFTGPDETVIPDFKTMTNGIGNGSIVALDTKTGNIKWKRDLEFPTWCSPLVTDGLVFACHVTATGVPYQYETQFGGILNSPLISSGILMALDADTGETLWQFNVGSMVGIGGPSIGNGMLLVPTGGGQNNNAGGYIIAFGLPTGNTTGLTDSQLQKGMTTQIVHPVMPQRYNQTAVIPSSGMTGQTPSNATKSASTLMAKSNANASATSTTAGAKSVTIGISAKNIAFNTSTITVPAGSMVTVNFDNMDSGVAHNVAFYTDSTAKTPIYVGAIITGPKTTTYTFAAPSKPGTYFFRCDVHPVNMVGKFIVQ